MARKPADKTSAPLTAATQILVLVGKEEFLQAEHTSRLRDMLQAAHGEVDLIRFDGATAQIADVLDECRTFGLMQQHKLVVVDHGDQLIKEESRPLMERYAQSPSENAALVLRCARWYPGKLDKIISEVGTILKCDEVTHATAVMWATKRCEKRHQARLHPDAAEFLVDRVGRDLGRLDTELAKLALAVAAHTPAAAVDAKTEMPVITPEAVAAMVGMTREEEAWAIQETLLRGDASAALAHLRSIMDSSRRDAHIPLSWAMLDLARKLHSASRGLRGGGNPWDVAGKLKLWPEHRKEAVLSAARRVPADRLSNLLKAAVEADMRQKSGGDPERTLELMAIRFARALG